MGDQQAPIGEVFYIEGASSYKYGSVPLTLWDTCFLTSPAGVLYRRGTRRRGTRRRGTRRPVGYTTNCHRITITLGIPPGCVVTSKYGETLARYNN